MNKFLVSVLIINIYTLLVINNYIPISVRYLIESIFVFFNIITDKTLVLGEVIKIFLVTFGNAYLIPKSTNSQVLYWLLFINILYVVLYDGFKKDYGNFLTGLYLLYNIPLKIISTSKNDLLSKEFILVYTLWNIQFLRNYSNNGSELLIFCLLIPLISIHYDKWLIHRALSLTLSLGFDKYIPDEKYKFLPTFDYNKKGKINGLITFALSYLVFNYN